METKGKENFQTHNICLHNNRNEGKRNQDKDRCNELVNTGEFDEIDLSVRTPIRENLMRFTCSNMYSNNTSCGVHT